MIDQTTHWTAPKTNFGGGTALPPENNYEAMAAIASSSQMQPPPFNGLRRNPSARHDAGEASSFSSSSQVAHTLTACTRCRQVRTETLHEIVVCES